MTDKFKDVTDWVTPKDPSEPMTDEEQAKAFVPLLRAVIRSSHTGGISHEIMSVCINRMGAAMAMELGMSEDQFMRFAGEQYRQVPLHRKQPA